MVYSMKIVSIGSTRRFFYVIPLLHPNKLIKRHFYPSPDASWMNLCLLGQQDPDSVPHMPPAIPSGWHVHCGELRLTELIPVEQNHLADVIEYLSNVIAVKVI